MFATQYLFQQPPAPAPPPPSSTPTPQHRLPAPKTPGKRAAPDAPRLRRRIFLSENHAHTVHVNAAVVPRWREGPELEQYIQLHSSQPPPADLTHSATSPGYFCHYTLIDMDGGKVVGVRDVWVEPGRKPEECRDVWTKLLLERRIGQWVVYDNFEHAFTETPI